MTTLSASVQDAKVVARFSSCWISTLMNIPKERNQKIGQAKEGLSCNKILQLNSEAMNARVLFFNKNVGMGGSTKVE